MDSAVKYTTRSIKIGRPAYKVLKSQDTTSGQWCLQFEIAYPEIEKGLQPRHRFMSAFEQRVESPDKQWQYLVFAAAPYSNIGFKIPARPVDKGQGKFLSQWDEGSNTFTVTLHLTAEPTTDAIDT
jgi:splicing factor 3A subunit 2